MRDYSCVCCAETMPGLSRLPMPLRCGPCQAAYEQMPPGWSLFRSLRDGRWYPLRLGRYQIVDVFGTHASFDTSARCVAYAIAAQREYERMWRSHREQEREYGDNGGNTPPGSGGAA